MAIDILSCSNQQLCPEEEVDSCQQKVEHGQCVMKSSGNDDKNVLASEAFEYPVLRL